MERKKVILIEDEVKLARFVELELRYEGYDVTVCHDGREGLQMVTDGNYDMILLDLMLPGLTGIEICRRVRKFSNVPIIMLTAKDETMDKVAGLDSGADDYLTKPFATKELLARIRAMTRRQTEATDPILSFQNITLNRSTFELSSEKANLRLANKEFQMMEMLMANPGQVISTERFMEKIWGYDSNAELNVVWVYISYLRKKLISLEAGVQIRATRNLGYSLEAIHA